MEDRAVSCGNSQRLLKCLALLLKRREQTILRDLVGNGIWWYLCGKEFMYGLKKKDKLYAKDEVF